MPQSLSKTEYLYSHVILNHVYTLLYCYIVGAQHTYILKYVQNGFVGAFHSVLILFLLFYYSPFKIFICFQTHYTVLIYHPMLSYCFLY